jgi:hypothetical protein
MGFAEGFKGGVYNSRNQYRAVAMAAAAMPTRTSTTTPNGLSTP